MWTGKVWVAGRLKLASPEALDRQRGLVKRHEELREGGPDGSLELPRFHFRWFRL